MIKFHTRVAVLGLVLITGGMCLANCASATFAVCLNCGEIHFGALNACESCGFKPMDKFKSGELPFEVLVLFSDHQMSHDTLKGFGAVVKTLKAELPGLQERTWALLQYLVDTYPDAGLINVKAFRLPVQYQERIPLVLKTLELPKFKFEPSNRAP